MVGYVHIFECCIFFWDIIDFWIIFNAYEIIKNESCQYKFSKSNSAVKQRTFFLQTLTDSC